MKKALAVAVLLFVFAPSFAQDEAPSWEWSDEQIAAAVNKVRAGKDLTPDQWPGGARVAVLLSFDVDNETVWLRNSDTNVGGLSQGEYGSRVALPRVLDVLEEHNVAASFFWARSQFFAGTANDRNDPGIRSARDRHSRLDS